MTAGADLGERNPQNEENMTLTDRFDEIDEENQNEMFNQYHRLTLELHRKGYTGDELLEAIRELDSLVANTIARDHDDE